MNPLLAVMLGTLVLPQEPIGKKPATPPPAAPAGEARVSNVQFDGNGWPIVADVPARTLAVPQPEEQRTPPARSAAQQAPAAGSAGEGEPRRGPAPAIASGMELGSPLLEVFQFVRSPGAFKALAGQSISWRITILGAQGEKIGVRELTHTADCAFAERDRVEHEDGRIYGRTGAAVFAQKQGMPWPTLTEAAGHELALLGLHLRLPWCFGDSTEYVVTARGTVDRPGERLARIVLERRPRTGLEVVGPELDPAPRDRFELLGDASTGTPRELVHRFASSGQSRRVLLEDWREVDGVRMPFRRVYVDEALRPTTMLEIQRIERVSVGDRDFRLH